MKTIDNFGLRYDDKTVLITGGSKGIGEGCARVFADAGANVVICARGVNAGEMLAKEIRNTGGVCEYIRADVTLPAELKNTVEYCIERFGYIDCLINNAGRHSGFKPVDEYSVDEFAELIHMNLISYFTALKYSLPYIRQRKGNIINISSLVGQIGQGGACIYAATKGAITSLTKSLAIEEIRFGVRVNCVSPGNIATSSRLEVEKATEDGAALSRLVDSWQPIGRSGTNEEVGQLCLFLASGAASYITGADIIISGGSELGYGIKYPFSIFENKE